MPRLATALWWISPQVVTALDAQLGLPVDSYVNGSQTWFTGEDATAAHARWEAGERDQQVARDTADRLARAREQLRRAEKAGHKPTAAAAWLTLGDALLEQAYLTLSRETVDEMVAAHRSAAGAWPGWRKPPGTPSATMKSAATRWARGASPRARAWRCPPTAW